MAACGPLQHIHLDSAVAKAIEFLPEEEDGTIRAYLAAGLASQFAYEAIEPLRQIALDGSYDESFVDLKPELASAATLMGIAFPERELWKSEAQEKWLERKKRRVAEETQRLGREIKRLTAEKQDRTRKATPRRTAV